MAQLGTVRAPHSRARRMCLNVQSLNVAARSQQPPPLLTFGPNNEMISRAAAAAAALLRATSRLVPKRTTTPRVVPRAAEPPAPRTWKPTLPSLPSLPSLPTLPSLPFSLLALKPWAPLTLLSDAQKSLRREVAARTRRTALLVGLAFCMCCFFYGLGAATPAAVAHYLSHKREEKEGVSGLR